MKHIAITKQNINGSEVNSVLARDLYDSLGLDKSQFSRWSKKNIIENEFANKELDYIVIDMMSNGKFITDYALTIEFAKNLSMLARSKEGEATRQYFLKIEKQHNSNLLAELKEQQQKTAYLIETQRELHHTQEIMGEMFTGHEHRLLNLENNTRINSDQEKNLLDLKNRKVYELAKRHDISPNKLHRNVWSKFKNHFHLPRYSSLTAGKYEAGMEWLENVTIDMVV